MARASASRSPSPARDSACDGWCRNLLARPLASASSTRAGSSPLREARARLGELGLAVLLGAPAQLDDRGHGGARALRHARNSATLALDDRLGVGDRGAPALGALLDDVAQVVDGVEEDVLAASATSASTSRGTAKSTMNIGRWRRALSARSISPLPRIGSVRRGAGDDDVEFGDARGQVGERDRLRRRSARRTPRRARACGWRRPPSAGAARRSRWRRARPSRPRRSGSSRVRERSPKTFCASLSAAAAIESDCAPSAVSRAHLLRHREGVLEEARRACEPSVPAPSALRTACFTWPEDLRLAQHHGIEPGGDAEGVAHGGFLGVAVEVRARGRRPRARPGASSQARTGAVVVGAAVRPRCGCRWRRAPPRRRPGWRGELAPARRPARSGGKASFSRTSRGALWWLMPRTEGAW